MMLSMLMAGMALSSREWVYPRSDRNNTLIHREIQVLLLAQPVGSVPDTNPYDPRTIHSGLWQICMNCADLGCSPNSHCVDIEWRNMGPSTAEATCYQGLQGAYTATIIMTIAGMCMCFVTLAALWHRQKRLVRKLKRYKRDKIRTTVSALTAAVLFYVAFAVFISGNMKSGTCEGYAASGLFGPPPYFVLVTAVLCTAAAFMLWFCRLKPDGPFLRDKLWVTHEEEEQKWRERCMEEELRGMEAIWDDLEAQKTEFTRYGPLNVITGQELLIRLRLESEEDQQREAVFVQFNTEKEMYQYQEPPSPAVAPPPVQSSGDLRPTLGIEIKVEDDQFGNKNNVVVAYRVLPSGPAEQAGIESGDVLTRWDGQVLDSKHSFVRCLKYSVPGRMSNMTIVRDGRTMEIQVEIGGVTKQKR
jgi:hypothetical protein